MQASVTCHSLRHTPSHVTRHVTVTPPYKGVTCDRRPLLQFTWPNCDAVTPAGTRVQNFLFFFGYAVPGLHCLELPSRFGGILSY